MFLLLACEGDGFTSAIILNGFLVQTLVVSVVFRLSPVFAANLLVFLMTTIEPAAKPCTSPETIQFSDVIAVIDANYDHGRQPLLLTGRPAMRVIKIRLG